MRILIAPDAFKGTLTAAQAAAAMATGWHETQPAAELTLRPVSDGGPGFVEAMSVSKHAPPRQCHVVDSFRTPTTAQWCMAQGIAFIEVAQAVGLNRGVGPAASSFGVGQLIREALVASAQEIVVGLGGTNVTDGGAGMLAALGALAFDHSGRRVDLDGGPLPLLGVAHVDLTAPLLLLEGIRITIASDVDVPLLGPRGAVYGFARQKGAEEGELPILEEALAGFSAACGRRSDGRDAAVALGAGAAGGLGFALLRLGAERVPGIEYVLDASDLGIHEVDLVVTGEGALDWQSMRGKTISGLARRAMALGVPIVALAGRVDITARERSEMGLDAAYSVSELVGVREAIEDPAVSLRAAAARVARTWG